MKLDLDEQDLALLHGMQIAPRVSWSAAASILGSTPATVAARWDRLRSDGLAWVTAHPAGATLVVSLVEVDCRPESRAEVVRAVCADPRAATVEESARDRDLLLTVMTPDLPELTRFALDELSRIPGVQRTRTHLTTAIHWQGSSWRLDALDPRQRAGFERVAAEAAAVPDTGPPPDVWLLIEALAHDGRASAADLARLTGRNAATVRRQLPRLIASGCWPSAARWLRCPPSGRSPAPSSGGCPPPSTRAPRPPWPRWPSCGCASPPPAARTSCSPSGVRSLQRLLELERLLAEKLPWLGIVESGVTLRTPKRMGWMLDDRGRATGEVIPVTGLRAAGRRGQVAFTRRSAT